MSEMCQQETHAPQQRISLVDHLIGSGKQRPRNCEAQRLRGREIDEQLEIGRLHYWKVSRFFALEDAAYMETGLPKGFPLIWAVAHK